MQIMCSITSLLVCFTCASEPVQTYKPLCAPGYKDQIRTTGRSWHDAYGTCSQGTPELCLTLQMDKSVNVATVVD